MDNISVIIPTYRPQNYIWECLDSLRTQTLSPKEFEVLIILNGEKEPYFSMIQNYIQQNNCSNFNLFYSKEKGVSNARNVGLDNANGTYITFIDDDDYVSNTYLASLLKYASPDTISLSNFIAFSDKTRQPIPHSKTLYFHKHFNKKGITYKHARKFFSGSTTKLIPRNIINNRRFDPQFRIGEDSLFFFLISDKYQHISFTSQDAIYYRRFRDDSVSIGTRGTQIDRIKNSIHLCSKYIQIFSRNPRQYSFIFLITRILGTCRSLINKSNPFYSKYQKTKKSAN